LLKVVGERNIQLHTRLNLKEVDSKNRLATFEVLGENRLPTKELRQFQYNLLHIGPPCSPIKALRECASNKSNGLTDESGWVKVDPLTLRSQAFSNVFAIGDCTNTPNSKTAAAVASQLGVLEQNLTSAIKGEGMPAEYDGYSSCPLVTDRHHVILAEFNSSGPMETFPFDQGYPSRLGYLMKRYLMPFLYWNLMLNGKWNGPSEIRKLLYFFAGKKVD